MPPKRAAKVGSTIAVSRLVPEAEPDPTTYSAQFKWPGAGTHKKVYLDNAEAGKPEGVSAAVARRQAEEIWSGLDDAKKLTAAKAARTATLARQPEQNDGENGDAVKEVSKTRKDERAVRAAERAGKRGAAEDRVETEEEERPVKQRKKSGRNRKPKPVADNTEADVDDEADETSGKPLFTKIPDVKPRGAPIPVDWNTEDAPWQQVAAAGEGGFATALIYCKAGPDGSIADRVVIKDVSVTYLDWCIFKRWHGDPRSKDRQLIEIHTMSVIRGREASETCVELRSFTREDDRRWYRLYLEFCPGGSLEDVIAGYRPAEHVPGATKKDSKARKAELTAEKKSKKGKPERWPPKQFVLRVFRALVEACCLMAYGALEPSKGSEAWEEIVHRDIKPDNVLLGVKEDGQPYLPAKLADFGVAIALLPDDVMNPMGYNGNDANPETSAPEMCEMRHSITGLPMPIDKLGWRTNVWQVGTLIGNLVHRFERSEHDYSKGSQQPSWSPSQEPPKDFKDVLDLVDRCTRYQPENRVDLQELRREVARRIEDVDEETGQELEHAKEDKYALGLAMPPDPTVGKVAKADGAAKSSGKKAVKGRGRGK